MTNYKQPAGKLMHIGRMTSLAAGLASIIVLQAARADVGRTPGAFNVAPTGAATYSIPIWVPPGPGGVAPSISLNYNSYGENGIMGVGWTLSGLSSIERCGNTPSQDGTTAAIMLGITDRLCLDGMKLRQTGSVGYGMPGSTYQSEFADFSETRYTAGTLASGPLSFEVRSKDGLTRKYGTTDDSRVFASGSPAPHRWKVDKVSDRYGNSYTVEYIGDNAIGHRLPATIRWTRENATSSNYIYSMAFQYEVRPDIDSSSGFIGGAATSNKNRLKAIRVNRTENGTTKLLRKYALRYDTSPTTSLSRLTQVQECADNDETQCLGATVLTYQAGPGPSTTRNTTEPATATLQAVADFNGDGRDDLAYIANGQWKVLFGTNGALGVPVNVTGLTASAANVEVDDFMPNGRAAFLANVSGTLRTFVATDANGDGIWEFTGGVSTGITNPAQFPRGVDWNGDGLSDLMWVAVVSGTRSVRIRTNTTPVGAANPTFAAEASGRTIPANTGSGGGVVSAGTINGASVLNGRHRDHFDMNGDGREDVYLQISVSYVTTGANYLAVLRNALTLAPVSSWLNAFSPSTNIRNFNDDACNDTYNNWAAVSKCTDAAPQLYALPSIITSAAMIGGWADWDGDGRTDILINNGSILSYALSTGNGFGPVQNTAFPAGAYFTLDLDGDKLPDLARVNGAAIQYHTRANGTGSATLYVTHLPDLLESVTDGYGVAAYADYVSTAQNNYAEGAPAVAPLQNATGPSIVVGRSRHTNGVGGTFSKTYNYVGSRFDTGRFADVGFQEFHEVDSRTQFTKKTYFEQFMPKAGMVWKVETLQANQRPVSRTTFINAAPDITNNTAWQQRYFRYVSEAQSEEFDLDGPVTNATPLTTTSVKAEEVDSTWGNVGKLIESVTDKDSNSPDYNRTLTVTTSSTFEPANTTNWCIGLVNRSQVEFSVLSETPVSRTKVFTPDITNCRGSHEHQQTVDTRYDTHSDFEYDDFGNMDKVSVIGKKSNGESMLPRVTETTYDDTGTFPKILKNAAGEQTTYDYNYDLGLQRKSTEPNNFITSIDYDAFGRQLKVTHPDKTATKYDLAACGSSCFGAEHRTTVTVSKLNDGGAARASQITYMDRFDRPLVLRTKLLNGGEQWSERQYNARGQLVQESLPCTLVSPTASCATDWVVQVYDDYGRLVEKSRPMSAGMSARPKWTYAYVGRKTTTTDPELKPRAVVTGINGKLRQTTDANDYTQTFTYNPAGSLMNVSAGTNVLFAATYEYGRGAFQITNSNPARGKVTNTYNSFGERTSWTDASSTQFTADYDALSRVTSQSDTDNTNTYEWGAANSTNNDVGQLKKASSTAGGVYIEEFFYDSIGRPLRHEVKIAGEPTYSFDSTYDPVTGLLDTYSYPTTTTGNRLVLRYGYTNGVVSSVARANTSQVIWTADTANVRGQVTGETLGQNIYSATGIKRQVGYKPVTGLLDTVKVGFPGSTSEFQDADYAYDRVGNVTQRRNNKTLITENFYYGGGPLGDDLYRLEHSSIVGGPTPGTNLELTYDAIGNILTRTEPGLPPGLTNYTVTWNKANYPTKIETSADIFEFAYGPMRERWKSTFAGSPGAPVETTFSIGGLMEKVQLTGTPTRYVHYVYAAGSPVALYTRTDTNAESWRFILTDHQGTIDTLVPESGDPVRMSFTAFGDRRGQSTWSGTLTPQQRTALDAITREGYTFQTALGSLGMNHMNGRIQDARTGRFLSPDPMVSDPTNSQDFNRYSYVYNNPVTLNDPSGLSEGDDDYVPLPGPGNQPDCTNGLIIVVGDVDTGQLLYQCEDTWYPPIGAPYDDPTDGRSYGIVVVNSGQNSDSSTGGPGMNMGPNEWVWSTGCLPSMGGCSAGHWKRPWTPQEEEWNRAEAREALWNLWLMVPGAAVGDCLGRGVNEATDLRDGEGCSGWEWAFAIADVSAAKIIGTIVKNAQRIGRLLKNAKPGDGFSGVIDMDTGKINLRQSTYDDVVPEGQVKARGGHQDVSAELGGNKDAHRGFAIITEADGTFRVSWNSGLNGPGRALDPALRQDVVNAIESATGVKVSSW